VTKIDRITCFDLCCGAGALSEGFHSAGATIVGGIDINPQALASARKNCSGGAWEQLSIEQLAATLPNLNGHPLRTANTLLAGLPCQGFSRAGKRDPDDPRNSLYKYLLQVVAATRPDHIVFENVVGMTTAKNKYKLDALVQGLRRTGYNVAIRILDSSAYGVPQCRKRIFLAAVRAGKAEWVFECLRPSHCAVTVRDAFRGLAGTRESVRLSHVFMNHSRQVRAKLSKLKPGGPISYRRLVWDEPAGTLVSGHRALPVHPRHPRAISVREAARLQGFTDAFLFEGSASSQIEQVANAVPPPLAKAVCSALGRYQAYGKRIRGPLFQRLVKAKSPVLRRRLTNLFRQISHRRFPWRTTKDPYRILLTEILLQRTNADLAKTVWRRIVNLVPGPRAASLVDLRSLGSLTCRIGIRSRARTIKELGRAICSRHHGQVPTFFDDLMRLPGVGLYIASAIRSICFGKQDFPVDSNAFRFVSRYFGVRLRGTKSEGRQLREFMSSLMPKDNTAQYVYGFLDFAAKVCRPINPLCGECRLRKTCRNNSRHSRY
jgi:DNA (cytosine-5)-methyltransferase 1